MEVAAKRCLYHNRLVYGHYVTLLMSTNILYYSFNVLYLLQIVLLVCQSLENRTGLGGGVSEKDFLLRRDAMAQGGSPNIE